MIHYVPREPPNINIKEAIYSNRYIYGVYGRNIDSPHS